ncbi:hypothetical protein AB1N83_011070 [Pleurotus pulmonarius]
MQLLVAMAPGCAQQFYSNRELKNLRMSVADADACCCCCLACACLAPLCSSPFFMSCCSRLGLSRHFENNNMQEDAAREAELFQVQPHQSAPMESTPSQPSRPSRHSRHSHPSRHSRHSRPSHPSHPSRSNSASQGVTQGDRTPAPTGHGRTPSTTRNNDEVSKAPEGPDTLTT